MGTTIIFSQCRSDETHLISRQESLLAELQGGIIVIEHLYDLTNDSETIQHLRQTEGDWIVLARLYPRAIRCILDQWHLLEGRTVECFDWRTELPETVTSQSGQPHLIHLPEKVESRWYPVIDRERCTGCCECLNFCLFGVYSLEGDNEVTVDQPNMCRPGCPACARVCPSKAIIFPECDDTTIAGK